MDSYNSKPGPSCGNKRKQLDEDEVLIEEPLIENEYELLDNDEDDEDCEGFQERREAEYKVTLEALKGQEPATIGQYDDIKITPFNVDEELEEGEFDRAGNFVFQRKSPTDDENIDTWADSIDWKAVEQKEREEADAKKLKNQMKSNEGQPELVLDKLGCYKNMLRIMRPNETVQKTIRRLGENVPKRRFNKQKIKSSLSEKHISSDGDIAEAKRILDFMIELTHQRLEDGDTDIYQKSYEILEEAIN